MAEHFSGSGGQLTSTFLAFEPENVAKLAP
jgi:hypothetical protein